MWLLVLGGVISVLFGVLVFVRPSAGAVAIVVLMLGLFGMFEADDRRALLNVLRHPIRVVLEDSEPGSDADHEGDDIRGA